MKRNIVYSLIPAATALFLLASCNREEMPGMEMPQQTDSPQEIRFEMAYATSTIVPDNDAPGTRVSTSTDGAYTNTWEDGDEVGVYIVKGDATLQASDNWVDNMKMTYHNGGWDYTLPTGKERYPIGEPLNFYAYYPYSATTDPTSQRMALPTDQSGQTDFSVLTARTMRVHSRLEPVRLEFSSALAMIELSLKSGGDGGKLSDRIVATAKGCKLNFILDLETGKAETEGNTSSVILRRVEQPGDAGYRTSYTYRALVPAQTLAAGSELFCFTYKNVSIDNKLIYSPAEAVKLEAGQVKPFKITLKPAIDPSHVYNVGDIYPHNGLPMGVVYEVNSNGLHGKIVYHESIDIAWGKADKIPENEESGRANMRAVYEANSQSFDGYPVFQWADNLNPAGTEYPDDAKGIWYLPAQRELIALCDQWDDYLADSFKKLSLPDRNDNYFGSSTATENNTYFTYGYLWDIVLGYGWKVVATPRDVSSYFFAIMEF